MPDQDTEQPPTPPDGEQEPAPTENESEYAPVFFTSGVYPDATGSIATLFSSVALEDQRKAENDLYTFLWNSNSTDLLRLNVGNTLLTALVVVPTTNMVKVVYGFGVGSAGVWEANPLQDKMLMLFGEGSVLLGPPKMLALEKDCTLRVEVNNPGDTQVQELLTTKGRNFGRHLIAPRNVTKVEEVMRIAPIPAYFVYNGFSNDLNAADIYEQILHSEHQSPMLVHAKTFLQAQLVGPLRNEDNKLYVGQNEWNRMLPVESKMWRKDKLESIMPSLFKPTPIQQPMQHLQPQAPDTTILTTFLESWKKAQGSEQKGEEKKEDTGTLKASNLEKDMIKKMCGLPRASNKSLLPKWYTDLFNKHQDDKDREQIVAEVLTGTLRFEDAEILVYPELKKIILKKLGWG